jgi:hypothetical protein
MAAATVRYATCHKLAGRDVAGCSHHAPRIIRHSARARDIPDARVQEARLRGCGGPACAFPGPMTAVRAWLMQPTHRAAHSTRCAAAASPYCAPSNMTRAVGDWQHSAPCNSRRARHGAGAWCVSATHRHSQSSLGPGAMRVCGRSHACARDLSVSVCMCMPALGRDKHGCTTPGPIAAAAPNQNGIARRPVRVLRLGPCVVQTASEALCPMSSHQTRFAYRFGRRIVEADHGHEESAVAITNVPQMFHTL